MNAPVGQFTRLLLKPFANLLAALDQMHDIVAEQGVELVRQRAENDAVLDAVALLTERLDALTSDVGQLDDSMDVFRRRVTEVRDLPNVDDADHFRLAGEYSRFVLGDLRDLTEAALAIEIRRRGQPSDARLKEARIAGRISRALFMESAIEVDVMESLLESGAQDGKLRKCLEEVGALRAKMEAAAGRFEWRVVEGEPSDGSRLMADCGPGLIHVLVAPAYTVEDRVVTDNEALPAGPWVYTCPMETSDRADQAPSIVDWSEPPRPDGRKPVRSSKTGGKHR